MHERWRVFPKVIRLGTATTEDVPQDRLDFYGRLVGDTCRGTVVVEQSQTIYLSIKQLRRSAWQVFERLIADVPRSAGSAEGTVVLVDLTLSPPEFISQTVAAYVGRAIGSLLLADPGRQALVMMPALDTGLQRSFRDSVGTDHPVQMLIRYEDGSEIRVSAEQVDDEPVRHPDPDFEERLRRLNQPIRDRLGGKILRRLGHFRFGTSEGHCTRYFFDASYAVQEVSHLTEDLVIEEERRSEGPLMLLSHHTHSPWLTEVGAAVAQRLGIAHFPLLSEGDLERVPDSGAALLLLDVVNTGNTIATLVKGLQRRGLTVRPTILAVFVEQERLSVGRTSFRKVVNQRAYQVRSIADPIQRLKRERGRCEQCLMGIPAMNPLDRQPGIRPFDMWEMLLAHDWVPEQYGPGNPHQTRGGPRWFPMVPNFRRVFKEYGDWIAYKLDEMLETVRISAAGVEEIVYVCPAEPAMDELINRLKARQEDRSVAVKIPRSILEDAERSDFEIPEEQMDVGWGRQLSLLAERDSYTVALIDEFNASNTTALSMLKVLEQFEIRPTAYLPVINRNPDSALRLPNGLEVTVCPLYEIPAPRSFGPPQLNNTGDR
ncbi:hypothetical protein [Micromonospora zamorensis]|uniref:hypothetical protein n=1 Tax=Micromonospora zamorensis TaxID=709883 RepID=UPI0033B26F17